MYLLIKIAQKICSPLGISLAALLCLCLFPSRRGRLFAWVGFLNLLLFSLPVVSDVLMGGLEAYAPARPINDVPAAAAIVVLGGTAAPEWGNGYRAEELAGSRLLTAFRAFRAGKAPKIIVTSGIAYHREDGSLRTEAEDMKSILIEYGVPETAIILENQAQNTDQNALYSAKILRAAGINEIILVTSAYHMQRAGLWFILQGLKVHPVGAGFASRGNERNVMDFLPSATALNRSSAAIKEYLGLIPIMFKL